MCIVLVWIVYIVVVVVVVVLVLLLLSRYSLPGGDLHCYNPHIQMADTHTHTHTSESVYDTHMCMCNK